MYIVYINGGHSWFMFDVLKTRRFRSHHPARLLRKAEGIVDLLIFHPPSPCWDEKGEGIKNNARRGRIYK